MAYKALQQCLKGTKTVTGVGIDGLASDPGAFEECMEEVTIGAWKL